MISYTLVEDAVAGYTSGVTGDIATGFVVTNTHAPTPDQEKPTPTPDQEKYTTAYGLDGGSADIPTPTVNAVTPIAKTGDDPVLALVTVAVGLLGASALVLARRLR
jgi:hypothetical protein